MCCTGCCCGYVCEWQEKKVSDEGKKKGKRKVFDSQVMEADVYFNRGVKNSSHLFEDLRVFPNSNF